MPFNEELPEWNQEGAEPSQDKKDNGFTVLERPPAGYFDWFFNRTYRALKAFKDLFNNHEKDYISHTGFAVATGSSMAYVITLNPGPTELKKGMSFKFQAPADSWENATLKVNATPAGQIIGKNGANIKMGALKKDMIYEVTWSGSAFILQGEGGGEYGNVTEGDVLAGVEFGTEEGLKTGSLALTGNVTPAEVLSGKTFYNDDAKTKRTGTMPNRGTFNLPLGATVPAGYYSGGTVPSGKKWASGSFTNTANINVASLGFRPSYIIIRGTRVGYDQYLNLTYSTSQPLVNNVIPYAVLNGNTGVWSSAAQWSISSSGFSLIVSGMNMTGTWIAFE